MTPSCSFCRIAAGDLEAAVVAEDDLTVVFLDHRPLFAGHCLVVPRDHHGVLTDLPSERVGPFFVTVQRTAAAVQQAMDAEGTFVACNNGVSQSVPHLHVHVVPRRRGDGLRGFFWPRTTYADGEIETVRAAVAAAFAAG